MTAKRFDLMTPKAYDAKLERAELFCSMPWALCLMPYALCLSFTLLGPTPLDIWASLSLQNQIPIELPHLPTAEKDASAIL